MSKYDDENTFAQIAFQGSEPDRWAPPMDVYETEVEYVVRVEIPGVRKQDLRLGFRDNTLTIWGERTAQAPETKMTYLRMEIDNGEFRREIDFSHKIHREAVQARYKEGFLKVVLPKHEQR